MKHGKKDADSKKHWETYFNAIRKQDWQKALEALNILKEEEPNNSNVHFKMGDLLQRAGQNAEAVSAYHKAAVFLVKDGFEQKAVAIYKVILRLDPDNAEALQKSDKLIAEIESQQQPKPEIPAEMELQPETPFPMPTVEPPGIEAGMPEVKPDEAGAWPSPEAKIGKEPVEKMEIPAIFSGLKEDEFREIIKTAELRAYADGEAVIEEGDTGDSIFIIKEGGAKVIAHIIGRTIELARLEKGDVFGEVAFLTGRPRTASVVADGGLETVELTRFMIEDLIEKNHSVLDKLQDFYYSRVQNTIKKVKGKP